MVIDNRGIGRSPIARPSREYVACPSRSTRIRIGALDRHTDRPPRQLVDKINSIRRLDAMYIAWRMGATRGARFLSVATAAGQHA